VAFQVAAIFLNQGFVEGLSWLSGVNPGEEVRKGLGVGPPRVAGTLEETESRTRDMRRWRV